MKNDLEKTAQRNWSALYAKIYDIADKRADALAAEYEIDEAFDRGVRSLRTLMSAAEVSRRMKQADDKEQTADDAKAETPALNDAELEQIFDEVLARVERIEEASGEDGAGGGGGSDASVDWSANGKTMERECP